MVELLPCPFCGGQADYGYTDETKVYECYVKCTRCYAEMRSDHQVDLIEAWNLRVDQYSIPTTESEQRGQ